MGNSMTQGCRRRIPSPPAPQSNPPGCILPVGNAVKLIRVSAFSRYLGWSLANTERLLSSHGVRVLRGAPGEPDWFDVRSLEMALFVSLAPGAYSRPDITPSSDEAPADPPLTEAEAALLADPPGSLLHELCLWGIYNTTLSFDQMRSRLSDLYRRAGRVRNIHDALFYPPRTNAINHPKDPHSAIPPLHAPGHQEKENEND